MTTTSDNGPPSKKSKINSKEEINRGFYLKFFLFKYFLGHLFKII